MDLGCYGLHAVRVLGTRPGARRSPGADNWCHVDLRDEFAVRFPVQGPAGEVADWLARRLRQN
jgi:hypothetical protein